MTEAAQPTYVSLIPGDPFPWFSQRSDGRSDFAVDAMAGRYIVLCFFGSIKSPDGPAALDAIKRHRHLFDDEHACLFGVSVDPGDEAEGVLPKFSGGVRFLWDSDASVSRLCGAAPNLTGEARQVDYNQFWLIVDPTLHVLAKIPFAAGSHDGVFTLLSSLPYPDRFAGFEIPAPVLVLPNVFDQGLCRHLVGLYDQSGGEHSGVYRAGSGVHDRGFKVRKDYTLEDQGLMRHVQGVVARKVIPEIEKLFFMKITRMERYLVGCYAAEDGGHFRPHRDNGPGLTAHRRFAISINLTGDFEGGEVSFPEYNRRGIKAPPGWCVVFPCAILHMVSPVRRGRRYAFLPFVYDDEGAKIRQREIESHQAASAVSE